MTYLKNTALCLSVLLALVSCENEKSSITENELLNASNQSLLEANRSIAKKMGYDSSTLVQLKDGSFMVENDLHLTQEHFDSFVESNQTDSQTAQKANYFGDHRLIKCWKVKDIRVKHMLNGEWADALHAAINELNSVSGTFVRFNLVWDRQDTTVVYDSPENIPKGVPGSGNAPANGWPGKLVRLIPDNFKNMGFKKKKNLILHELLHTLGLAHIGDRYHIGGSDHSGGNGSIMATSASIFWLPGLGEDDKNAMRLLYSDRGDRLCKY